MNTGISFPFLVDLVGRWVNALLDVWNTLIADTLNNFIDDMILIFDQFPITQLINLVLIPLGNLIDNLGIGDLTLLEFTLGFGFGLYLFFTFLRWIWNTFPVV